MSTMAHAMAHTAHSTHPMESRMGRSKARSVTDSSCCSHSIAVATAHVSSASPMNTVALAVDSLRVLRMRGRHAGTVRVAHDFAKVQPVIVRNFSPALPRLVQCDNVVEALPSGISQQVRLFYSTPT
jgi:hypothetical protein